MNKELKTHLIANHGYRVNDNGERLPNTAEKYCRSKYGYIGEYKTIPIEYTIEYYNYKTVVELPTLEEFIEKVNSLACKGEISVSKGFELITEYAKFISTLLTLSMFVPVKDGKVLEEPECFKHGDSILEYEVSIQEYQTAQSNVLFEGWFSTGQNTIDNGMSTINFSGDEPLYVNNDMTVCIQVNQISDLLPFGLKLKV